MSSVGDPEPVFDPGAVYGEKNRPQFGTRVRHADGRCCKADMHGRFVVTAIGVDDPEDGTVYGRVCDRPIEEHLLVVPTQEAGDPGPASTPLNELDDDDEPDDEPTLVPAEDLSERELWALRIAAQPTTPPERRELLDFLGWPESFPASYAERVEAVVRRILAARARGEHIA